MRAIQREMQLSPDFPPEVEAAARSAAERPSLPDLDCTDIPFVTIDPEDARDLDQALYLERDGDGYVVRYAIADVAAFVEPGGAVDLEAHRRGETLYGATTKIPLHPRVLSEGAASLLPDQVCPAVLWTIRVDASGEGVDVDVRRALVRSRAKLDYTAVQEQIDAGTEDEVFTLLREVGELRIKREQARGGINLPLPEQEIVVDGDRWSLRFRAPLPVEEWNAQISLLTGMAAAHLMVSAEVGILRTLPEADPEVVQRLHRTAAGLGISWPAEQDYPDFIRGLDPSRPQHAAMVAACTQLLRGSGYVGFQGAVPEQSVHAALAAQYAHVTAPLRRLVDRYAAEVCVALCGDRPVPEWTRSRLSELPATMEESGRRAGRYEAAILGLAEAGVLAPSVGQTFTGVITEVDRQEPRAGSVVVRDPAIEARVEAHDPLPLGQEVLVRLVHADLATRSVRFELG
ncbi:MAG TPA: RNB domain-containing ribonuclease [Nocardioidaceae bacterium]|nr:RNB domain-containing ribonuclease [Nocardioidaceae bacterium]